MTKKIMVIITILLILLFIFTNMSNAANMSDIYGDNPTKAIGRAGDILGYIVFIGYIIAIIMLIIMGIRFVIAAPEGKAELKKTFVPYVIGCVILFSGSTLIAIIQNLKLFQ